MVRPSAVIVVADANPITLINMRQLSRWADLVLAKGTRTTAGGPRRPLRAWADARTEPSLPDGFVEFIDDDGRRRPFHTRDFLNGVDAELLRRPRSHIGQFDGGIT